MKMIYATSVSMRSSDVISLSILDQRTQCRKLASDKPHGVRMHLQESADDAPAATALRMADANDFYDDQSTSLQVPISFRG